MITIMCEFIHLERIDSPMMTLHKRVIALVIFSVIIVFIICQIPFRNTVKIGITSSNNVKEYSEYFKENKICNCKIQFVYLGNDKEADSDPFKATFENIYRALSNGDVDMVIAVEEDYLLPMTTDNVLYNLKEIVDFSCLSDDIKNFIESSNNEVYFIPSSLDSVRVLLVNNNLMTELGIPIPQNQLEFDEFCNLLVLIEQKIKQNDKKNTYALSLGSPIDEFLYDDISKFLSPLYNYADLNMYLDYYVKLLDISKRYSYRRKDIGNKYPLDFHFSQNNIVLKIATLYELELFKNSDLSDKTPHKPYIQNFSVSVLPHPYIDGYNYTLGNIQLMAVSRKTKHLTECADIIKFFLSEKHARNIIELENPFSANIVSIPVIQSDTISESLYKKYSFINFHYGDNFSPHFFPKNYDLYWQSKNEEQELVNEYIDDKITPTEFKLQMKKIIKSVKGQK